ncbi:MAG: invasion associated locus B family protein [Pseudomonadota bacterium]
MFSLANGLRRTSFLAIGFVLAAGIGSQISFAAEKSATKAEQPVQTTATYGDWTVRCRSVAQKDDKLCEMIQVVPAKNKQGAVANLAVGRMPGEDKVRLVVQLPIGVHLPSRVAMKVGTDAVGDAEFQSCFSNFCLARSDLDPAALKRLKDGKVMTLAFKDRALRDAAIQVSLKGFTAAHDATFKAGS